ncbi:MAG: GIY-YIG nuclease family protein [Lewinellaceae bacterium]|nr:GIY-YIG nuclease family protein [Lewinellaceae bacterium]MCB9296519.1 GIY-YIG nuclease family protein [Lewinellaceae bacterium]MCB9296524.1 GIY-YIG nuclease family protein [Lewinellaceae bacterium]
MHYAYILYSPSADKYYVGQTPELETRLLFHNELSENSFTSRYRPWVLERAIAVNTRSEAMALERYIKGRKSKRYIRKLIDEEAAVKSLLDKFNISPPGSVG